MQVERIHIWTYMSDNIYQTLTYVIMQLSS